MHIYHPFFAFSRGSHPHKILILLSFLDIQPGHLCKN
nr:MAG TPA: hypothetical protein [Caudoviricetes sp.]